MQNLKQTKILAETMVNIGKMSGRKVSAVITSMDEPLDRYIGNSLEIQGATEVLSGEQNELKEVAKALAVEIMLQSGKYDLKSAQDAFERQIASGEALSKFRQMLTRQGAKSLELKKAKYYGVEVKSQKAGYLEKVDTRALGRFVMSLGGGRMAVDDKIDHTVGLKVLKRVGDKVEKGESVALLYCNEKPRFDDEILSAFTIGAKKAKKTKLIVDVVR